MTAETNQDLSSPLWVFDCVSIRIKTDLQPKILKFSLFVWLLSWLVVCIVSKHLAKRQFIPFYVFLGEAAPNDPPSELCKPVRLRRASSSCKHLFIIWRIQCLQTTNTSYIKHFSHMSYQHFFNACHYSQMTFMFGRARRRCCVAAWQDGRQHQRSLFETTFQTPDHRTLCKLGLVRL